MNTIYIPKGKAREYSDLALNIYDDCDHGCLYCYVPALMHKTRSEFLCVRPRAGLLEALRKYLETTPRALPQVLLCFTCDPYNQMDVEVGLTREVLKLFLQYRITTAILTKGGQRCLRDLDIFKDFKDQGVPLKVGASLTFTAGIASKDFEPFAAEPVDRLDALGVLHAAGIHTWVSMEPVIDPVQTLTLIHKSKDFVDEYQIGKINHTKLDRGVDWRRFVMEAVKMLRRYKRPVYIKDELSLYAPAGFLRPQERERITLPPREPLSVNTKQGELL